LGKKYLINHSAGSGKTLTIAWMADLLDSLYTAENEKIFDNIIILTDRRSLYKNVKDDLVKFTHLQTKLNFTKHSGDLANFLDRNRAIIVTTIQKFGHIQDKLKSSEELKNRKVAFLIDEAHRSQDGKMALRQRQYFNHPEEADFEEGEDTEAEFEEKIKNLNTSNQVFVAFTATTTPKSVSFFGEPFDSYSEEEAIKEGYILDVAQNIISYETLYHLNFNADYIPKQKNGNEYPSGIVSKALKTIAFNDDDLIQYKSEVIVKLFEEKVLSAANGQGKAMVVASSRPAGLKYFRTIKTILEEKGANFKALFAFSDYTDPITNETVEEVKINQLDTLHNHKVIEDVFDLDDYKILVVANKFQTGFDQPLLTAMFLDKPVNGINAIQTVSRLNRKHVDKEQDDILVVDFTNNSDKIFEAFNKHRKGSPFKEKEPDKDILPDLYKQIIGKEIFTEKEIQTYIEAYMDAEIEARKRNSTADALLSNINQDYRTIFKTKLPKIEDQKDYISLLNRFVNLYYFIAQFFVLELKVNNFIVFAEVMADTLIKKGKTSELKQLLKNIELTKGAVKYHGSRTNIHIVKEQRKTGLKIGNGGQSPPRTTIEEALAEIVQKYQISKEDAIVIKEICEEVSKKYDVQKKVKAYSESELYLKNNAEPMVKREVRKEYENREQWEKLEDPIYVQRGGIISLMGKTIIKTILSATA
jgi:type I restriction enzyme, R subunit